MMRGRRELIQVKNARKRARFSPRDNARPLIHLNREEGQRVHSVVYGVGCGERETQKRLARKRSQARNGTADRRKSLIRHVAGGALSSDEDVTGTRNGTDFECSVLALGEEEACTGMGEEGGSWFTHFCGTGGHQQLTVGLSIHRFWAQRRGDEEDATARRDKRIQRCECSRVRVRCGHITQAEFDKRVLLRLYTLA